MKSSFLDNLSFKKNSSVPIWLMRQAGRYMKEYHKVKNKFNNFLDMCKNEQALTEITLQPIKKFDFDAAIIFSDILLLLDALNIKVNFVKGTGPVVMCPSKSSELRTLPKTLKIESLLPCYKAINNIKRELASIPLIGFAAAPWTLATYYIEGNITKDLNKVKSFAYKNPEDMDYLINLFTQHITDHLVSQIKAGVDVVQIFDTHAFQMDYSMHEKYSIKQLRKISEAIKEKYPTIPIIYYTKANINKENKIENYINCLSLSSNVSFKIQKLQIKKNFCYQGNLDPSLLVIGGEVMKNEVIKLLRVMKDDFFIFNLGHGVLPQTPTQNVFQLLDIVRNFKK